MQFADATAVSPSGEDLYDAAVAPGWDVGGNANGGYLLSIAGRAMAHRAGRADPVTITAHYLSPGKPGPLLVETEIAKAGKRFTTVRATVRRGSDNGAVIAALGTFGDLDPAAVAASPARVDSGPPDLPPVEDCVGMLQAPLDDTPGFVSTIRLLLHPDDAGFATGRRSGELRVRGWFNLRGDEPIGSIGLLTAVDAFPPTIFNSHLPVGWVPTVELTAHVRARPQPGWLRCAFTTRFVTGGFIEEDGEVWDQTGTLVAQSRQLALLPRDPPVGSKS